MNSGVYVGVVTYVYGLIQCSTNELVYVGHTRRPAQRFTAHLSSTVKDIKNDCRMEIFEAGIDLTNDHEYFWIEYMRSLGCNLRNKYWMCKSRGYFSTDKYNSVNRVMPHLVLHMNQQNISVDQMMELSGFNFCTITHVRNGGKVEPYVAYRISNVLKYGAELLYAAPLNTRKHLVRGQYMYPERVANRIKSQMAVRHA